MSSSRLSVLAVKLAKLADDVIVCAIVVLTLTIIVVTITYRSLVGGLYGTKEGGD